MPRKTRIAGAMPLLLPLDHASGQPLHRQIYAQLRKLILERCLPGGSRLPSTRVLAAELAVSRNTVLAAFEQLAAEGYVEGRAGRGTSVAHFLPDEAMRPKHDQRRPLTHTDRQPSRRGACIAGVRVRPLSSFQLSEVPFRRGCALADFPVEQWGRLARRHWSRPPIDMLDYGGIAGFLPLREEVAAYLRRARGVICVVDQVIIVNGSQQGLNLAAHILADPGDAAWIEDPGYDGSRAALQAAGIRTFPIRVDA